MGYVVPVLLHVLLKRYKSGRGRGHFRYVLSQKSAKSLFVREQLPHCTLHILRPSSWVNQTEEWKYIVLCMWYIYSNWRDTTPSLIRRCAWVTSPKLWGILAGTSVHVVALCHSSGNLLHVSSVFVPVYTDNVVTMATKLGPSLPSRLNQTKWHRKTKHQK